LECFCCDCSTRAAFVKAALAKAPLTAVVDPTPVARTGEGEIDG